MTSEGHAHSAAAEPDPGARSAPEDWRIYRGTGEAHDGIDRLPPPPRWRAFDGLPVVKLRLGYDNAGGRRLAPADRGRSYQVDEETIDHVNSAMYLRRPLLVTGRPGTGKSTLAYSIAYELKLGPVLYWPITSRSTVEDGLYRYDAVGRLQEASLKRYEQGQGDEGVEVADVGRYVRLGPLGTALLPQARPRVLLLDELDKSDVDLPNDLLNIFEEGAFEIPELARLPEDKPWVKVMIHDGTDRVQVERGRVMCRAFPIVILTSNGERAFPPAFLRRCVRLEIKPPDERKLALIIESQLGSASMADADAVIQRFLRLRDEGDVATDQLLNALYLTAFGQQQSEATRDRVVEALLRPLDNRPA
ncbi:MoxR family ATPase [Catellatospora citrea]|uniref:MoxR family ATPase n=1 Tax=Catellatospora citrea TaxID=53366 RepID=UPI0033CB1F12